MELRKNKGTYLVSFLCVLIAWQIISIFFNKSILPAPTEIFLNTVKVFEDQIALHLGYSMMRIALGILFTLCIGVPLGIAMGYNKKVDTFFSPLLYFSYPVPKIALLPIIMLLFGLGEVTKVVMITLIVFFPIVVNVRDEVKNIPDDILYPMYSIGAKHYEIIRDVIVPAVLPALLTSLRIGIGTAISVLFFTENFGTQYGMGFYIMDSWMRISYIDMYSGICILSLLGLVLFVLIDLLESRICSWNK